MLENRNKIPVDFRKPLTLFLSHAVENRELHSECLLLWKSFIDLFISEVWGALGEMGYLERWNYQYCECYSQFDK